MENSKINVPYTSFLGDPREISFVRIPPGEFMMGSPMNEVKRDRELEGYFKCKITFGFYMAIYPTTVLEYNSIVNDRTYGHDNLKTLDDDEELFDHPVANVSWKDAVDYCKKMNEEFIDFLPKGCVFSLPTEAMWEYSCRAGTTSRYYCGDDDQCLDEVAWHAYNSSMHTHAVGQKQPNSFGLFDMHGNVSEWCLDNWLDYPDSPQENWFGKSASDDYSGLYIHMIRGAAWNTIPECGGFRSAARGEMGVDERSGRLGFRLTIAPKEYVSV